MKGTWHEVCPKQKVDKQSGVLGMLRVQDGGIAGERMFEDEGEEGKIFVVCARTGRRAKSVHQR